MAEDTTRAGAAAGELERLRRENARLTAELADCRREVGEAREQQAAITEILRAIVASGGNAEAILTTIAEHVTRIGRAADTMVFRVEGDVVRYAAHYGPLAMDPIVHEPSWPLSDRRVVNEAIRDRRPVHVLDRAAEASTRFPDSYASGQRFGVDRHHVTWLAVPLLVGDEAVGGLVLRRETVDAFAEHEIAVIEAFAAEAALAIENARLFDVLERRNRDLTEAVEQQTATAEVLRVIASSPTDLQRVLDAIVEAAAGLCHAPSGSLQAIREQDGRLLPFATYGMARTIYEQLTPEEVDRQLASVPTVRWASGRAFVERRTIRTDDLAEAVLTEYPDSCERQRLLGLRSIIDVPFLRRGEAIGLLSIQRLEVKPFTDREAELLETFADQAVIAIENARLFEELQERTRELARSVDELTALGAVSQAVSSTLDLQKVLTTIVSHAVQLSEADGGTVYEFDAAADAFVLRAAYRMPEELVSAIQTTRPRLDESSVLGRAARSGTAVQVPDLDTEGASPVIDALRQAGFRAPLAVPLVRERRVVGALVIRRKTPGAFPQAVVDLLQTFSSQSVLAIENARPFEEVQQQGRALEAASTHKSEFLANMSHELRTPLNAILSYSQLLREEAEDAGQEDFVPDLEKIHGAGQHLLGLINDILDLSKIEAGKMDLYLETFDVAALVRDAVTVVRPLVEKNGNALVIDCSDELGAMHADQTKLGQSLLNLLSNASKFTEHGTVTLTVRREPNPRPGPFPEGDPHPTQPDVGSPHPALSQRERGQTGPPSPSWTPASA